MKNGVTRIQQDAIEKRVVDLFTNTALNRVEIGKLLKVSNMEVGRIVAEHHAIKGDIGRFVRPEGYTPCMLTLEVWPKCLGNGCYWAGENSVCPAYNAMKQERILL